MPSDGTYAWGLEAEKHFLNHLGTGKWSGAVRLSKKALLTKYIEITPFRKEVWAKGAVAHAKALLALED